MSVGARAPAFGRVLERGFTTFVEAWAGRSRRQPAPGEAMFLFAGARMYMNLSPVLWIASSRMLAKSSAPTDMLMSKILGTVDRKRYRSAKRNAAAVVLEVGGVLQHGAVVAREYGKPCVIGIDRVTERLQDGDIVEVDGATGTVRIDAR